MTRQAKSAKETMPAELAPTKEREKLVDKYFSFLTSLMKHTNSWRVHSRIGFQLPIVNIPMGISFLLYPSHFFPTLPAAAAAAKSL